jgi:2-dehydropantoate 2-reductase
MTRSPSAAPTAPSADPAAPAPDRAPFHVVVVGAGAVGAVLGGHLAQAGVTVTFVARGATLAALLDRGLELETPTGVVRVPRGHAAAAPADAGPADVVLVAVKAEQVSEVAATLQPLIGPSTVVVPLQNGVEASGQLAAALGDAPVAEGFCRMWAEQTGPARVRFAGLTPSVAFGPRGPDAPDAPRRATLARLADAFRAAGVVVETSADTRAALWEKFLFVEPLGAVGAAARSPFGALLGTPDTRSLLEACTREILAVGRAAGVALADDAHDRVWERYAALPPEGTASMQRDLVAGRPSELEAQTGAVVRIGRALGVPTPAHDALYAVLRPQELRARAPAGSSSQSR